MRRFLDCECGKDFRFEKINGLEGVDGGKYVENLGEIQILPHDAYDGFYIAKLRRMK